MREKDKKEEERRKKQKRQGEAERKLAENSAIADAKVRRRPAAHAWKRKGDATVAGAKMVKRSKVQGERSVSDMQDKGGNLQPAWSQILFSAATERVLKSSSTESIVTTQTTSRTVVQISEY